MKIWTRRSKALAAVLMLLVLGAGYFIFKTYAATADTTAPTGAKILAPKEGSIVKGTAVLVMTDGTDGAATVTRGLSKATYYLDNSATPFATKIITSSSFGVYWNTSALCDGVHGLRSRVYDIAGNASAFSATVKVTTQNGNAACATTAKTNKTMVFDATRTVSACTLADAQIVGTQVHNIFSMPLTATSDCSVKALTTSATVENWWPRVSHDATKILYYQTPLGVYEGSPNAYSQTSLHVMNIDGTGDKVIIAKGKYWPSQGHAEWSPDDKSIVMFGGDPVPTATNLYGYQIYVTDANGANLRQVTERIVHGGFDPSWSPDGATIIFASCPDEHVGDCTPKDTEIVTVPASAVKSKTAKRLTTNTTEDADPYMSPDGKTIAWISKSSTSPVKWGIYKMTVGGVGVTGTRVVDDGNINSKPEWTSDSQSIYFHRYIYNANPAVFQIYKMKADGTGLTKVTTFWRAFFNANYDFPSLTVE